MSTLARALQLEFVLREGQDVCAKLKYASTSRKAPWNCLQIKDLKSKYEPTTSPETTESTTCTYFCFFVFLQVFVGNSDSDTVVKHYLTPAIKARYVRLTPTAWNNHISMRIELYGCLGNWPFNPTLNPTTTNVWLIICTFIPWESSFKGLEEFQCYCTACDVWETGH